MKITLVKYFFIFTFVGCNLLLCQCSIRFDEVQYYDPDMPLDKSDSNGLSCAHLGEQCRITAECCGVATCALPSWSPTPVCLVPGYKHDKRFKNSALHNLRPEDIKYIRDSYNTSLYDFLLTDLTFSAPPILEDDNSSVVASENVIRSEVVESTKSNDTSIYYKINNYKSNNTESLELNNTSVEEINNSSHYSIPEKSVEQSSNEEPDSTWVVVDNINLSNSSKGPEFDLNNHFKFLLVNNTMEGEDSNPDAKEVYEEFVNSNRIKTVVELLREKMKRINKIESVSESNRYEDRNLVENIKLINSEDFTENIATTPRLSKWDIVKHFFLPKSKDDPLKSNHILTEANFNVSEYALSDYPRKTEDVNNLIQGVNEISDIFSNSKDFSQLTAVENSSETNDENALEFYNIDIPLNSNNEIDDKLPGYSSLESILKQIGNTFSTVNHEKEEEDQMLKERYETDENKKKVSSFSLNDTSVMEKNKILPAKLHFWDKANWWQTRKNISHELARELKHWFVWKKNSNSVSKPLEEIPRLNEYFLLTVNSNNDSKNMTDYPITESKKEGSSDCTSSTFSCDQSSLSTEDLYNNSYVFMVHKNYIDVPEKLSSWRKVLSFFHKDKVIHNLEDTRPPDTIGNNGEVRVKAYHTISDDLETVTVPDVIRLPEHLMPEALEGRQVKDTDWVFTESEDAEDVADEEPIPHSPFLFFLRNT